VSEEDQLKGYGPDVQVDEVRTYLVEAGLTEITQRVIQEESTTWNRPQFEAILDEAIDLKHRGELEVVVFPRTDRLARKWDAFGYYIGMLAGKALRFILPGRRPLPPMIRCRQPCCFSMALKPMPMPTLSGQTRAGGVG